MAKTARTRQQITTRNRRTRTALLLAAGAALAGPAAVADVHTAGAPALSSKPGAAYTIFLDFSGFNFTGTWGGGSGAPGSTPAYAGAVGSFTTAQQASIAKMWSRTAEKYSEFNVDVTTVDPAVAAGQAGTDFARQAYYDKTAQMMHTVIGAGTWDGASGGVSYIGVDRSTESTTPNGGASAGYHTDWVFTNYLGGNTAYQAIAEATAHENGHGLGLNHQSDYDAATNTHVEYSTNSGATGNGSFAPIMGDSYSAQRGLFRNGTQDNGTIENDPKVVEANPNMVAYTADGVGHSTAAATAVPMSGALVNFATAKGVIVPASTTAPNAIGAANYTSDFYQFNSGGGSFSLTVHDGAERVAVGTADYGPTLASTLTILDAGGNAVATANTNFATLSETITQTLPAGTYYAEVSSLGGETGTFNGSTNTYYDMGSYFLTGTGLSGGAATNAFYVGGASAPRVFQVDNPGTAAATTNLRTDLTTGTDPGVAPTQTTNLFLAGAASGSPLTVTLGANGTVNSLSFTGTGTAAATTPVVLAADGFTLTLRPVSGFVDQNGAGYNPGTGLVVQAGSAAHTIACGVTLGVAQTWQVGNALINPLTITGVVAGGSAAGLTVTGAGRLVLAGADLYTGGTVVQGGNVTFSYGSLGSGPVTLTAGGTLEYAAANTQDLTAGRTFTVGAGGGTVDTNGNAVTYNAAVAGYAAGPLTKAGAGTLTLASTANPSNLFVRGGTVALAGSAAVTTATTPASTNNGYVSIGLQAGDNGTLTVTGSSSLTAAGDLNVGDANATGLLTIAGQAVVNARAFFVGKYGPANGTVTQSAGTVRAAANGAAPTDWKIAGNSAADAAAVGLYTITGGTLNPAPANLQVGGFGTGTLAVGGTAAVSAPTLYLAHDNGSTGTVAQTGGTVTAAVQFGGGQAAAGTAATGTYTLAGGTLTAPLVTRYPQPNVTATLNFNGGTLTPSGTAGTSLLNNLTYATVQAGGAIFNTAGLSATIDQTLRHDPALGVAADGGLTKLGTGTLTLDNGGTYTGPTTVTAGTLAVAAPTALGSGTVALNGGTLSLAGPVAAAPTLSGLSTSTFTLTKGGAGNAATVTNGVLKLTDGVANEANAAFTAAPQALAAAGFTTTFTYTASGAADGLAFVVQNDARGAAAVGAAGGALGYATSNVSGGIANSGAVEFNVYTGQPLGTVFATNGTAPAAYNTSPVSITSGHPFRVTLTYNAQAATLAETIVDTTLGSTYANTYPNVNFPALLGGSAGYVGFTAGTGAQTATQTVANFTFANLATVPTSIANPVTAAANTTSTLSVPETAAGRGAAVGPLTLAAGSRLTLAGVAASTTGPVAIATTALSVDPTATLDLAGNDLIVRNGSLAAVTALAASGYAGGFWSGTGLSSTVAAADPTHATALGVALNNDGTGAPLRTTLDGLPVSPTDVLVKYTYYGDANLDGVVNGLDYARIDAGFLSQSTPTPLTGWQNGDFNYDGAVDASDYTLIDNAFNVQGTPLTSAAVPTAGLTAGSTDEIAPVAAAVPEPTAVGVLAMVAGCVIVRRRPRVACVRGDRAVEARGDVTPWPHRLPPVA